MAVPARIAAKPAIFRTGGDVRPFAAITGMLASLRSAAVFGVEAYPVSVEVDVSHGLPIFHVVGLPDVTVRESRDRVRAAIKNSGYAFPGHRITVNLAPADVRKGSTSFDLPIALGLLATNGDVTRRAIEDTIVLGELSLDGGINAIRGVLPIAAAARRLGLTRILLPPQNAAEACIVTGLQVCTARSLPEAVAMLNQPGEARLEAWAAPPPLPDDDADLADVRGQLAPRRALEIAAAGGHNLLMCGPPGAGKTMLARRLGTILPPLTFDEALDCTAIHSVAGLLPAGSGVLTRRPFRAPHHSISGAALVGGGPQPRPGEISLAHHGVLFLDELPEFQRRVLDLLRQPLEEGHVTIARAARSAVFPSRFMLVAAMNPCPCGYAGSERQACRCSEASIARYHAQVSGPLRDRIDLIVDVPPVPASALDASVAAESSADVCTRVVDARVRQWQRYGEEGPRSNADLKGGAVARHCRPDADGRQLLSHAVQAFGLSARGHARVLKVARTIADLGASDRVRADDVAEALQYRLAQ
jgi:magnesium chelatase family protein